MAPYLIPAYPLNAPGDWYTDGNCLACGEPEALAPGLLAALDTSNGMTYFQRQPDTPDEVQAACAAAKVCCCSSIRYGGRDKAIIRALGNTPEYSDYVIGWFGFLRLVAPHTSAPRTT